MNASTLYRDIATGLFVISGVLSFVSGQFILSTMLFGTASLTANLQAAKPVRI
ncbi:hypothetical protein NP603_15855 [Methylomonas sp. SURF-1]|uniref:Uncharacterized protein n=1 Tax=Methylomonas aurea TaxID=2952224 RepID=A0ABT1UK37_9GAMM|nr:hypothetical protein [Methylomonas sp. SURF-1]MCQ8182597.1 hypothetical protein [Methylomonas sp. SURF-1]